MLYEVITKDVIIEAEVEPANEEEMKSALDGVLALKARAAKVVVHGNREYNPGWHIV